MFTEKDKELLQSAIDKWGYDAQSKQCIEECSELITAILHKERGKCSSNSVITEVADVAIMCEQMKLIYGEDKVNDEIRRKLDRLNERMRYK